MGRDFGCLIDQKGLCPTGKRNSGLMNSSQGRHHAAKSKQFVVPLLEGKYVIRKHY